MKRVIGFIVFLSIFLVFPPDPASAYITCNPAQATCYEGENCTCDINGCTCNPITSKATCHLIGNSCGFGGCDIIGGTSTCDSTCHPECSSPNCGQSNLCGGSCSSSDIGNITWGSCYDPGACGTHNLLQEGTDPCGNHYVRTCGTICTECGPYNGPWSACTAPQFQRVRTVQWDCKGDTVDKETCYANFTGTLFDASIPNNCNTIATDPKIVGATVSVTGQVNNAGTFTGTSNSSGAYTINIPSRALVPETYDLTYDVDPTKFITDPPKLLCDGALTGLTVSSQNQSITRSVGLYRIYGGWFQNIGGDLYAEDGISMIVPATCILDGNNCNNVPTTTNTPLIAQPNYGGTYGTPGLPFTLNGTVVLGGTGVAAPNAVFSSANWSSVGAGYSLRDYDYGYFFRWFGGLHYTTWDGTGGKPTGDAKGLYHHTGDLTWNQSLTAGEKIALLVDGNVTVSADVDVPLGSYLAIIASGNINFTSDVAQAEGHYIANGNLTVSSTDNTATDQRFLGEGVFVGFGGVVLQRDRGITNNSESSELFTARPDLIINAPRGIRNPKIDWQEVAP